MERALLCLLVLAAAIDPATVPAQVDTTRVDTAQAALLVEELAREINWRKQVRVSIEAGRVQVERPELKLDGLYYRDATWIVIQDPGTPNLPLPLPLDLIERIEVRKGHPLPGLAIGFLAGTLVGVMVAGPDDGGGADGNLGMLPIVLGAGGGALLGFIIGESRVTWRPVYRRPNELTGMP